jgi:2-amino-4-hydroxy-6-hydroxymethyldihydropteridine diphosphokinase
VTRAHLGLGANLGDRKQNLREALRRLGEGCTVVAVSSLYESPALVPEGEPPGPEFLNAACEVETDLGAEELLAFVKEIERALGRRPSKRWAARPIDIDVLLYGDEIIETAELTVPHAAMHERHFVLVPLAEIAADVVHPVLGRTIGELAADVGDAGVRKYAAPSWAKEDGGRKKEE